MTTCNQFGLAPKGFAFTIIILAVLALSVAACAQNSPYVVAAATADSGSAAAFSSTDTPSDEADQTILTIKKRVDEVDVFSSPPIATANSSAI